MDPVKIKSIQELRTVLAEEKELSDIYLRRCLEAKDYNVKQTAEMIRNALTWRRENDIDSLLDKKFDSYFETNFPVQFRGLDRSGNGVVLIPYGKWDIKKAVEDGKGDEYMKYYISILERMRVQNEIKDLKDGGVHGNIAIFDFDGYSYSQVFNLQVLKINVRLTSYCETHYPLITKKCFMINCPGGFFILWKALKQVLSQETQEMMIFRGSNRSDWEPLIQELIDPSQIPFKFGGELED